MDKRLYRTYEYQLSGSNQTYEEQHHLQHVEEQPLKVPYEESSEEHLQRSELSTFQKMFFSLTIFWQDDEALLALLRIVVTFCILTFL